MNIKILQEKTPSKNIPQSDWDGIRDSVAKNKGLTLTLMGAFEKAINYYDKILRKKPHDFNALIGKSNALMLSRKGDEALKSFKKALKIKPKDIDTLDAIRRLLDDMGRKDEAIKYCDTIVKIEPEGNLAKTIKLGREVGKLVSSGKFKEAIEYYDKLLELNPDDAGYLFSKALCSSKSGNGLNDIPMYQHVLELDPYHFESLFILGSTYSAGNKENKKEAVEYLIRALEISPDNEDVWEKLLDVVELVGNDKEEQKYFERIYLISPHFKKMLEEKADKEKAEGEEKAKKKKAKKERRKGRFKKFLKDKLRIEFVDE